MAHARVLTLDATGWKKPDDLYDAFFSAVGAPAWHGRNFNALNDSIGTGQINAVEVPYRIVIHNFDLMGPEAKQTADEFVSLIQNLAVRGCPVEIETLRSA